MSEYVKSFDPRIIGLTGVPAQIAVAAKSFKVFYERRDTDDGGYVYDHTTLIYLVDPDGRFVRALAGNADAQQIADALVAGDGGDALAGEPPRLEDGKRTTC